LVLRLFKPWKGKGEEGGIFEQEELPKYPQRNSRSVEPVRLRENVK